MALDRRSLLRHATLTGVAAAIVPALAVPGPAQAATWRKRLTGADLDTNSRWRVAGTDLGIPYVLENGSIGYLFGDTFNTPWPEGPPLPNDWRSPVMLRSNVHPGAPGGVVFDSAARVAGDGRAPELMRNGHNGDRHRRSLGGDRHPQRRHQLPGDRPPADLLHEHRELELGRTGWAAMEVTLRGAGVLRQRQRLRPYPAEVVEHGEQLRSRSRCGRCSATATGSTSSRCAPAARTGR